MRVNMKCINIPTNCASCAWEYFPYPSTFYCNEYTAFRSKPFRLVSPFVYVQLIPIPLLWAREIRDAILLRIYFRQGY